MPSKPPSGSSRRARRCRWPSGAGDGAADGAVGSRSVGQGPRVGEPIRPGVDRRAEIRAAATGPPSRRSPPTAGPSSAVRRSAEVEVRPLAPPTDARRPPEAGPHRGGRQAGGRQAGRRPAGRRHRGRRRWSAPVAGRHQVARPVTAVRWCARAGGASLGGGRPWCGPITAPVAIPAPTPPKDADGPGPVTMNSFPSAGNGPIGRLPGVVRPGPRRRGRRLRQRRAARGGWSTVCRPTWSPSWPRRPRAIGACCGIGSASG